MSQDRVVIPEDLVESAGMLLDWGCQKLTGGEGFSVLLMTHHPDGKIATIYSLDSVEEAIERAKTEINSEWNDLNGYVFCYDVTAPFKDGPKRGFLFELENHDCDSRFVLFHETINASGDRWSPSGSFIFMGIRERIMSAV